MLDGDQFTEDPVPVLQSAERFLGIPSFYREQHFTHNGEKTTERWKVFDTVPPPPE